MKKNWLFLISCLITINLFAQKSEEHFKTICATCHTIGKGLLVGPDLKGAYNRHPEKWLLKWIKSSQTMVNGGDKTAVELFNKYNMIPMPDNPQLSDADIKALIAYIKKESGDSDEKTATSEKPGSETSSPKPSDNKKPENNPMPTPVATTQAGGNPSQPENAGSISLTGNSGSPGNPNNVNGSGNLFFYMGISLILLFFLTVIAVLTRSVITLSNELKRNYLEKNGK